MSIEINSTNFNSEVVEKSKEIPVLVDFYATWCGHCKLQSPIIDELGSELKDRVVVGKFNVENDQELADKYDVLTLPTIIIFKNGEIVDKFIDVQPKDLLLKALEKFNNK